MTIEQVCGLLQVKRSTIYAWVHQGFIPHVKVGRLVRFRSADLHTWLEGKAVEGRPIRVPTLDMVGTGTPGAPFPQRSRKHNGSGA